MPCPSQSQLCSLGLLVVMAFFGRETQLAAVARRLEDAADGRGAVVLVHGELGIGKSRFIERAAELAGRGGASVASGRWYESPEVPAYVGFLECLSQLLNLHRDSLRGALDPQDPYVRELARLGPEFSAALGLDAAVTDDVRDQYGLWRGVVQLLEAACAAGPATVLVLDDLQWADSGSLDLLAFIARHAGQLPLVVLAAYRDERANEERPFGRALTALQDANLDEIALPGLDCEDVQALAERAVGSTLSASTAQELHEFTRGNPLFVEEIARQLLSKYDAAHIAVPGQLESLLRHDLPQSIGDVMAQRLAALSAECQYLLQVAAGVGRSFDLLIIEGIADLEKSALSAILQEAIASSVITEISPGLLAFDHPLMREVSHAATAPGTRMAIHARVASALETSYGEAAPRHAREIGNHLMSAGGLADARRTVRYCAMGAQQARVLFASEEMYRLARGALSALERLPFQMPRLRAKLLLDQAYADTMIGNPDESLEAYRSALSIYQELEDREGEVDCTRWIATTLLRYGRWQEAAAVTREALPRAKEARTHAYHALAGAHALASLVTGQFDEVARWSSKLVDLSFDDETRAVAHHVEAGHHSWGTGDPAEAMHHFEECRRYFLKIGHDGTAAQVAADHAVAAHLLGYPEQAREAHAESTRLAERAGRVTATAELCACTVVAKTHQGDWPAARAAAEHWEALSAGLGGTTIYGQFVERALALQRLWRDGPSGIEALLTDASPLRNEPLQAYLCVEAGDEERASGLTGAIKALVPADGCGFFWLSIVLPVVATSVSLRDRGVEAWLGALERYSGSVFDWFNVDIELGRAYTLLEDWPRAEACFTRAIQRCEAGESRCFRALAQFHHGVMWMGRRRRHDRRKGIALVEGASTQFLELGMDYMRAKAEQLLPKPRLRRNENARAANLTPREWQILDLLAEGRSNQEISEMLVISRRTVEHHLQSVYGKIAVRSRAAALAWLVKQNASGEPPSTGSNSPEIG